MDKTNKRRKESFYANKIILAPMVRVSALPMRLMALRFGANLVYTEEIVDFKLMRSKRYLNEELNTIDYIDDFGAVIFRTCEEEKDRVVLQIGTNDPERAVRAAKMVEEDVAAIDINMGCPKSFSLKGGMGAALLSKPELIQQIMTSLKGAIKKPVSCKIRVLHDIKATVELAKVIETGVDGLGVHGRTKDERPQHSNRTEYIKAVANAVDIPVIANGGSSDIQCFDDILKFRKATGASSAMVARAAEQNCSIFAKDTERMDTDNLIRMYLKLAIDFDNNAINTKYCIQRMLGCLQETEKGKGVLNSYSLESLAEVYDLQEYYYDAMKRQKAKKVPINEITNTQGNSASTNSVELPVNFNRSLFPDVNTMPKTILNRYCSQNKLKLPTARTYMVEKQFHTVLSFNDKLYSTPYLEKSKRLAEQSAALVLLLSLDLYKDTKIIEKCLITDRKLVNALQHHENGRTYYIKINK